MPTAILVTQQDHINAMIYAQQKVEQLRCAVLNTSNSILKDKLKWICNNSLCVKELEENCAKAMSNVVKVGSQLTTVPFSSQKDPSFADYSKAKTICQESITSGVLGDATCYLQDPERNPNTLVLNQCRTYPQEFLTYPCIRYSTRWANECYNIKSMKSCMDNIRCGWNAPIYLSSPADSSSPSKWIKVQDDECPAPSLAVLKGVEPLRHQATVGEFCGLKNWLYDSYRSVAPTSMRDMMSDYHVKAYSRPAIEKGMVDSFLPCTSGGCKITSDNPDNAKELCQNLNVDNIAHYRQGGEPLTADSYFTTIAKINPALAEIPSNCWWRNFGNSNLSSLNAGEQMSNAIKPVFDCTVDLMGFNTPDECEAAKTEWENDPFASTPVQATCVLPQPGNFQFNPSGEKLTHSEIWGYTFSPTNPDYKGCLTSLDCGEYISGPSAPSQQIIQHLTNFDQFIPESIIPPSRRMYGCWQDKDGKPQCHNSAAFNSDADPNMLFDCIAPPPSKCPPGDWPDGCQVGLGAPASPSQTDFPPDKAPLGYRYGSVNGNPGYYLQGVCALKTQFPVSWNEKKKECDYTNTLGKQWCMYPRTRTNTQPDPDDGKLATCVPPFEWSDDGESGEGTCNITFPYCDYFQRHFCAEGEACSYIGREGSPFTMGLQKTTVRGPACYEDSADSVAGVISGISADILDNLKWTGQSAGHTKMTNALGGAGSPQNHQIVYPDEMATSTWSNTCSLLTWSYVESDDGVSPGKCVMCEPNFESSLGGNEQSTTPPSSRKPSTCQGNNKISYGECQNKIRLKESFTNDFRNNLQKAFTSKEHFYNKDVTNNICGPLKEHFESITDTEHYKEWIEKSDVHEIDKKLIEDTVKKYGQSTEDNFKKKHYLLVDEDAAFICSKIQNNSFGEDIHLYSVRWEPNAKPVLTALAKDLEKAYPFAIKKRKYKGVKRKFLKLTPNLLRRYPALHKVYTIALIN